MGGHTFVGDEMETERAQSFIDLIYETADGYISVAVQSNKEWAALARAFGKPEWVDDPRFATAALRGRNIDERLEMTQAVLRTDTAANWLRRLEAEDVPCAPVLSRREVIRHAQIAANESLLEYDHPVVGPLRQARPAPRFAKTPTSLRRPAPALGQHSREVLAAAGVPHAQIDAMMADGVIRKENDD